MQQKPPCFVCATDAHGFYEAAITLLRATGHRITKPREVLLEVLSSLDQPKTPTDLFDLVSTHHHIDRPAVNSDPSQLNDANPDVSVDSTSRPKNDCTPDKISIDKVTVYRTLQAFESLGIVHQTRQNEYFKCSLAATQATSSGHTAHESEHYHIVMKCERCNATLITRPPTDLINSLKKFLQDAQFTLTSDVIEVSGMCASCRLEP